jgi:hypothetical protein
MATSDTFRTYVGENVDRLVTLDPKASLLEGFHVYRVFDGAGREGGSGTRGDG